LVIQTPYLENNFEDFLQHLPGLFQGEVWEEVFDKVREAHHEIMEHVGSHIDAGNYLLVYQGFLELVLAAGWIFLWGTL
jgi:hypothetical protein